jgi:hypothetical protein
MTGFQKVLLVVAAIWLYVVWKNPRPVVRRPDARPMLRSLPGAGEGPISASRREEVLVCV